MTWSISDFSTKLSGMKSLTQHFYYSAIEFVCLVPSDDSQYIFRTPKSFWLKLPLGTLDQDLSLPSLVENHLGRDDVLGYLFLETKGQLTDLGRINYVGTSREREGTEWARFALEEMVDRDCWSLVGSYLDWSLMMNGRVFSLAKNDNIDLLLKENEDFADFDLVLTSYDGDRVDLIVNGQLAYVHYRPNVPVTREIQSGKNPKLAEKRIVLTTLSGECEVPQRLIVGRTEGLDAVKRFFHSGNPE